MRNEFPATPGVLLAGGLALVLVAPRSHHESAATVRLAPLLSAGVQGAAVGGSW